MGATLDIDITALRLNVAGLSAIVEGRVALDLKQQIGLFVGALDQIST